MSTERASANAHRRQRLPLVVGWLGVASVATGYLLEATRQRGDCDAGDKSPDTLAISIVLIVLVGGLCGIIGIAGTLIPAIRHRRTMKEVAQEVLPSLVSLAGALAIFVVAGDGPSTWFQYCAT